MSDTGIQDRAGATADTAKHQASEVASTATEQAKAVASDATAQARHFVETSRQQLRDQAGEQASRAASSLRDLGDQLRRMAAGQSPGEGPAVDLTRQAADGVQRVADSLDSRRPEELLDDVKRFARQRPGLFVLGALGAGFLAGRLLRSVDTSAIADAARSGAGAGGTDRVAGPGSLAGLQAGPGGDLGAGDALASGMVGTTPGDLADPPIATTPTWPPRSEPLGANGPTTGAER
jgi:hypothetical protein